MRGERVPTKAYAVVSLSLIFLISLTIKQALRPLQKNGSGNDIQAGGPPYEEELPPGVAEGVSAKSYPSSSRAAVSFNWTAAMFAFQRTAFHFQPQKNWMNDPDGPLFYKGWYHLFYQYNPDSAVWGNITWGHAVSTDLIRWFYLPIAMIPDQWYDINGVWTGSATILPDGQIVIIYTGDTIDAVQVQNVAYPANLSDPLLLDWVKYSGNPVLVPPTGIGLKDFRDPTTAWIGPDGKWRILIGSKINNTGIALVFKTDNFTTYEQSDIPLHGVPETGMWECVDFYPVLINGSKGLETSVNGPGVKHVLKASMDDTRVDQFAIGTYFVENDTWVPDNPKLDVGIGLRYDYGRYYYASKTFYDQNTERRILWGWVNETDTAEDDLEKGWASIQAIPRTVLFDNETGTGLLLWPVEEIESLRLNSTNFTDVVLQPGSVLELDIGSAIQLDIFAEFEITEVGDESGNSSTGCGEGATERSSYGPFGILVLADETLSELTPIYFNLINGSSNGNFETYLCADQKRSSEATGVLKQVYGTEVPVLDGEKYSLRVLVDHSAVESFAQGGRRVITSRVYPTVAINGAAKLFLFNNATSINVTATLNVWALESADIRPFSLDQFM